MMNKVCNRKNGASAEVSLENLYTGPLSYWQMFLQNTSSLHG